MDTSDGTHVGWKVRGCTMLCKQRESAKRFSGFKQLHPHICTGQPCEGRSFASGTYASIAFVSVMIGTLNLLCAPSVNITCQAIPNSKYPDDSRFGDAEKGHSEL